MISTMREFVLRLEGLTDISDAYEYFENKCSENMREIIYSFADPESSEPFRSAMYNIGFTEY